MPEAGAGGPDVDWAILRAAALEASGRAYAPYSRLPVGAAGLTEKGTVVTGCNVENASYGLTLCAECGMVSALYASGCRRLVAAAILAGDGRPLAPCGRCRQLLAEAGGPELLVEGPSGLQPVRELLPGAFDRAVLEERRRPAPDGPA